MIVSSFTLLISALLSLVIAPLLHHAVRRSASMLAGIDGFNFLAVSGLVLLHGLPESFEHAGWGALAMAAVGFTGPTIFEKLMGRAALRAHATALGVALAGLIAHALFDGSVIALGSTPLSLAIVMHRIPVGLAVWITMLASASIAFRSLVLILLGTATIVGYALATYLVGDHGLFIGLLEGLAAGSLLHVVFHRSISGREPNAVPWRYAAGLGGVAAIILLGLATHLAGPDASQVISASAIAFVSLALQSAPALLIAYFAAGLLDVFMPNATVSWLKRGREFSQSFRGVAFGLPLPICSCGVIPLYRSLVVRGAPATAALAFLVATPEIGIDAIFLSFSLLGNALTLVRVCCAALVAIGAGLLVGKHAPTLVASQNPDTPTGVAETVSLLRKMRHALRSGLGDVVDNTAPWILIGLGIAAIGNNLLTPGWLAALPGPLTILLFTLGGIPTYVCASGATPLVAMFVKKGISAGAAVAFLLTGPATNVTTFGVLSKLHGKKYALAFGAWVAGAAVLLALAIDRVDLPINVFNPTSHTHDGSFSMASLYTWRGLSLAIMAAVFLLSLLRIGPRGFVSKVIAVADQSHSHHAKSGKTSSKNDSASAQDTEKNTPKSCCGAK